MQHAWIIDDDKIVCTLVSTILKAKGFTTETYNERSEINYHSPTPNIVLLDLQLGEDYGKEVYKEILTKIDPEVSKNIKFVFMSSNTREESEEFHNLKEEDLFIQKPFKSSDLMEILS